MVGVNNIFTPLAVTIIPVGPDGESPPRGKKDSRESK